MPKSFKASLLSPSKSHSYRIERRFSPSQCPDTTKHVTTLYFTSFISSPHCDSPFPWFFKYHYNFLPRILIIIPSLYRHTFSSFLSPLFHPITKNTPQSISVQNIMNISFLSVTHTHTHTHTISLIHPTQHSSINQSSPDSIFSFRAASSPSSEKYPDLR